MKIYCSTCHQDLEGVEGSGFCPYCGGKVVINTKRMEMIATENKTAHRLKILSIVLFILVMICAIAAYVIIYDHGEPSAALVGAIFILLFFLPIFFLLVILISFFQMLHDIRFKTWFGSNPELTENYLKMIKKSSGVLIFPTVESPSNNQNNDSHE